MRECIVSQNHFLGVNDTIEVKLFRKSKNGDSNWAVIECNGSAFRKILSMKRLNIVYNRCSVYENTYIPRCLKCNGYNHKNEDCFRGISCVKCAADHLSDECKSSEVKCANSIGSKNRLKPTIM